MEFTLIKIRLIQLKRLLSETGYFYGLLLPVFLVVIALLIWQQFQQLTTAGRAMGAISGGLLLVHGTRRDKDFVLKHIPWPRRQLFLEYFFYGFLMAIPGLFSPQWYFVLLVLPMAGILANLNLNFSISAKLFGLGRLLGPQHFEWISGIRQYFPFLVLTLTLAYAGAWLKFVPLVLLWLFTATATSFYQQCEPLHILRVTNLPARKFLFHKIRKHYLLLFSISVPPLLINAFFYPQYVWVSGIFLILQFILLAFAILLKYRLYTPKAVLSSNSIQIAIAAMGIIVPVMLPLPLILSFRNYNKAVQNLNRYLHD